MTLAFTGSKDLAIIGAGMAVGATAFVAYCVATAPLVRRFGARKGSAAGLLVWVGRHKPGLTSSTKAPIKPGGRPRCRARRIRHNRFHSSGRYHGPTRRCVNHRARAFRRSPMCRPITGTKIAV